MNSAAISNLTSAYGTASYAGTGSAKKSGNTKESGQAYQADYDTAAVYEKSSGASDTSAVKSTAASATDRSTVIAQMKSDLAAQQQKLMDIVKQTISGQGKTIGSADDVWKFLASGDFTVDAAAKAQAQKDISEDGYWGVNQTSDRIVDFAKALTGNDSSKADKMIEAFKKGFEEATKTWGKTLPDISSKTYDATMEKLNKWKNSTESSD